jgi:hypothetical protein
MSSRDGTATLYLADIGGFDFVTAFLMDWRSRKAKVRADVDAAAINTFCASLAEEVQTALWISVDESGFIRRPARERRGNCVHLKSDINATTTSFPDN